MCGGQAQEEREVGGDGAHQRDWEVPGGYADADPRAYEAVLRRSVAASRWL